MSDIERNIDWETADYFASVGPEVRWAHLRGAYRVWVERYRPFEQSGWWSFDTLDEFIAHEEQWRSTLNACAAPTPRSSSSSSTNTA